MCGFAGLFGTDGASVKVEALAPMLDVMRYRGPDDRGTWQGEGVAFGHLRLTILDLTDHAHQPMTAAEDGSTLVYNGEVYNFPALRQRLERDGATFTSTGDTEVVFQALRRWGPQVAVERFNGMFAFAYWDGPTDTLWLARDKVGIKPLYVARAGATLLFASEIKALLAHPDVPTRPDLRSLPTVLMYGRVGVPPTLFEGVESLEAGALWRVDRGGIHRRRYFDAIRDVDPARILAAEGEDPGEAPARFAARLRESVGIHMLSDVPLATMCSGGVDSSLVTAYAKERVPDVTAYVADVGGEASEWAQAEKVGRHLGVPVHRIRIDRDEHLRLLPETTWHLDAPNCFSSDTALLTVVRRCREDGVKVLLTGEGSDELFGGYPWQAKTWAMWRRKEGWRYRLAARRRRVARDRARLDLGPMETDVARHLPGVRWRLLSILDPEGELRGRRAMERLSSVEPPSDRAFLASCLNDLYRHLASILQRHDRMGMAASMEMRVPFLEDGLIDFGLHAPRRWKYYDGRSKWVVKTAAEQALPRDVVHATKKGFPVPPSFRHGTRRFIEDGVLAELLRWGPTTAAEIARLAAADPNGSPWIVNVEVWARVFLRGDDPAEVGERLVAVARDGGS